MSYLGITIYHTRQYAFEKCSQIHNNKTPWESVYNPLIAPFPPPIALHLRIQFSLTLQVLLLLKLISPEYNVTRLFSARFPNNESGDKINIRTPL